MYLSLNLGMVDPSVHTLSASCREEEGMMIPCGCKVTPPSPPPSLPLPPFLFPLPPFLPPPPSPLPLSPLPPPSSHLSLHVHTHHSSFILLPPHHECVLLLKHAEQCQHSHQNKVGIGCQGAQNEILGLIPMSPHGMGSELGGLSLILFLITSARYIISLKQFH